MWRSPPLIRWLDGLLGPRCSSPGCVDPVSFIVVLSARPSITQSQCHLFRARVLPRILTRCPLCCLRVPLVPPPLVVPPSIFARWIAWFAPFLPPLHGPPVVVRPVVFFQDFLFQRRRLPVAVCLPSTATVRFSMPEVVGAPTNPPIVFLCPDGIVSIHPPPSFPKTAR